MRLLCTKVKPAHFHANEYIVRAGDIGQEMFIIRKGLVRNFQKSTVSLPQPQGYPTSSTIHALCGMKINLKGIHFCREIVPMKSRGNSFTIAY